MFNNSLNFIIDIFLPRICIICNQSIKDEAKVICENCFNQFEIAGGDRIEKEFVRKFANDKLVGDFHSAFVFHEDSSIQKAIHELKYNNNFSIGSVLGFKTADLLENKLKEWKLDIVLPIPLHHLRKATRGYNQAELIAKAIGKRAKIKFYKGLLKRNRFTETQTKLDLVERKQNMSGAFSVRKTNLIKGKNILLIDDVITTGATISECAKMLLESGANQIYAASVAIAD